MLFQLGALQVTLTPFNAHEVSRETGADFAAKDILGAPKAREFVGEADEKVTLSGRLYPHRFGGLDELEILHAMRVSGEPQILVRGDGANLGWFVVESVSEKSTYLDGRGVGRKIEVEIKLARSDPAGPEGALAMLVSLFG